MTGTLFVELQTPHGVLLEGATESVEMRTSDGIIEIRPGQDSHLSLVRTTEITLRMGGEVLRYALENAAAGLRDGRLTILAETARPLVGFDAAEEWEPS